MGWINKKVNTNNNINNLKPEYNDIIQEFAPQSYHEIEALANAMILQKPIKIDLTTTVASDRRRIIDFLCGISYVIGFTVDKKAAYIYEFKSE